MATKTNFTKEEWTLLLESPMLAGMAVTAADPSGLWGLIKESFANGSAIAHATNDANANPLVKEVAADFMASEGRNTARDALREKFSGGKAAEVKIKSVDSLRQLSVLLAAKAPDDATAFKDWLHQISESTANAASEGGLLGIGGVQISEAEKATLAEVSSALGR